MRGVMFEPDSVDIESFALEFFLCQSAAGRYWDQLRDWWPVRGRDDVLFLCYEDLREELRGAVAGIAAFCGIAATDALIDLATHQAGYDFMRAHQSRFDDQPTLTAFMELMGLPPARTTKVRAGRVGDSGRELSPRLLAQLEQRWRDDIAKPLGLDSYQALRRALRNEQAGARDAAGAEHDFAGCNFR